MTTNATIICHPCGDLNATAAKLLIMAAQLIAEPPLGTGEDSKEAATAFLEGVLGAAATGGYKKCDLLRAALGSHHRSNRLLKLAHEACKAAGQSALSALISAGHREGSPDDAT